VCRDHRYSTDSLLIFAASANFLVTSHCGCSISLRLNSKGEIDANSSSRQTESVHSCNGIASDLYASGCDRLDNYLNKSDSHEEDTWG
jgi:hypothetical protein